ncbi:hypothetical protein ACFLXX_03040 [Chloroflexota bacterium]
MAKAEMICPFSGKLCKECPIYRGRHYYLCFSKKYRGHLEKPGGDTRESNPGTSKAELVKQFEIPAKMPSAIDPFTVPMSDING